MAFPTSRFPTWATDGGADVTDPGSSKQATGYVEGEAPAADHVNWLHNARGEWLEYLYETTRFERGLENVNFTTETPFTSFAAWPVVQYLPGIGKWFAGDNAAGTDSDVYDSADGETWSSATTLDPGTPQSLSSFAEDDSGNVYVAVEDDIYKTTTGLASGFATVSPTLVNVTRIYDMHYSSTWSRFYVSGGPATPRLETATSAAFPVFSAISVGTGTTAYFIAEDDSGNLCVSHSDASVWYSSNGTTFTENTTPASALTNGLGWNAALGLFWGVDGANGVHFSTGGSATWTERFVDVYNVINTPNGLLLFKEGTGGASDNPNEIILCYGSTTDGDVLAKTVAHWAFTNDIDRIEGVSASGPVRFTSSSNKLVWTRKSTSLLTVADY